MRNIKIVVEYHGGNFFGWQKQEGKRTVQGELESAVKTLVGQEVEVVGSGRTDRGVHALGQVASFSFEGGIPAEKLKTALNNLLPQDVKVKEVEEVSTDFNARFSAKKKTYEYVVQAGGERSALNFNTVGFYPYEVDLRKMKKAARLLVGKHNFRAFCAAGSTVKSFEREIFALKITKQKGCYHFEVTGNGFLYNMVRIIVGSLLDVGRGAKTEEDLLAALRTGERKYAGITIEPAGLYLKKVEYETARG